MTKLSVMESANDNGATDSWRSLRAVAEQIVGRVAIQSFADAREVWHGFRGSCEAPLAAGLALPSGTVVPTRKIDALSAIGGLTEAGVKSVSPLRAPRGEARRFYVVK